MPRSLADGRVKFAVLTTKPADPAAPTTAELSAGLDASPSILFSDFTWTATDSDTVDEKSLADVGNAKALGPSNWEGSITAFRQFTGAGASDPAADQLFQAIKAKGTTLWCYARKTSKLATAAWATGDEIYLGGEVSTDTPQHGEATGFIKAQVKLLFAKGYDNIAAA